MNAAVFFNFKFIKMTNFFEGLASQKSAEITSELTKDNSQLEACGCLVIKKGILELEVSYWAKIYSGYLGNHIKADDFDFNESKFKVAEVEVDNLSKFKESLTNMGLSSVANAISISDSEIWHEIFKCIEKSKSFKSIFGSKSRLFDSMNEEDQSNAVLEYSIDNYENANAWLLYKYKLSNSSTEKPSLVELIELKKSRNNEKK